MKTKSFILTFLLFASVAFSQNSERCSEKKAAKWGETYGWLRGCNFQPSTAINQLEMWQADTFDPETIDRELGWAEDLGFNIMRVYLHHVAWIQDKEGFKDRLNQYLDIAMKHGIYTMFVFFDDCWNPVYMAGKQPDPKPGIHNSGWLQDPGKLIEVYPSITEELEAYVKDVLTTFKDDKRIVLWDLYNEPGNSGKKLNSLPLLKRVFKWAREVSPSQPVTAGLWNSNFKALNQFQVENSDVITYHNYNYIDNHKHAIDSLKKYNRPIICSEYMARKRGSLFQTIMPMLKENKVGAINWGFVSGKTNTIYAWDTPMPSGKEPDLWFHDILRKDGSPFSEDEIRTIKSLTGKN